MKSLTIWTELFIRILKKSQVKSIGHKKTSANTGFASSGVMYKLGALCFYSSIVLVDSVVLRNPFERKARERYKQAFLKHINNASV